MYYISFYLQLYCFFVVFVMLAYSIRHFVYTYNRSLKKQDQVENFILDSEIEGASILIPMHNEELVCKNILDCLLNDPFVKEKCQIICVNDHSSDKTEQIIKGFQEKNPQIEAIHRHKGIRGKPSGLNEAIELTKHNHVIIFDADYLPQPGLVKYLSSAFLDPEVGLTMGRVVPINEGKNLLTRLISFERSGGYQVEQQARYNLRKMPQYGGTVGGFRKDVIVANDKFSPYILAEDTDVTVRLYSNGWKIHYQNGAECYEEAIEDWKMRGVQIQRWSRGHNQVFLYRTADMLRSKFLNWKEKLDSFLTIFIYFVPLLLLISYFCTIFIFYLGAYHILFFSNFIIIAALYFGFGNIAPFHQITLALSLDEEREKIKILPLAMFTIILSLYYSSKGAVWAIKDRIFQTIPSWNKTQRFRQDGQ